MSLKSLFQRKPKKSAAELAKEREAKIASTSNSLKLQIRNLEKKKDILLRKVLEAKQKNLTEQEAQARSLLKQTLAAIKRENGMLMTLELAIESRDLAQLNSDFLDSIGTLSDDILSAGSINSEAKTKRIGNKFLRAVYESNKQKERIDGMLSVGEYASAVGVDSEQYAEFDDEIDSLVEDAQSQFGSTLGRLDRTRF
jgi:hypothetical protein